jgi:hypothetical protein
MNCGPTVPYADEIEGSLWARCLHCDQVIGPWDSLDMMIELSRIGALGFELIERGCSGGSKGCGTSSCGTCGSGACPTGDVTA